MRYNINDIVKFELGSNNIYIGKIVRVSYCTNLVDVKTDDDTYVFPRYNIIENLTEETEEENNKNCLAESLIAALKCDRCSTSITITCAQKSTEERLREENEKLKKELELAKQSEKHLEICENALLEKDAEIEKLKKELESAKKSWEQINKDQKEYYEYSLLKRDNEIKRRIAAEEAAMKDLVRHMARENKILDIMMHERKIPRQHIIDMLFGKIEE